MIEELQSELTYVREQNAEILRITKIQQSTLGAISFPTFSYYKFPTALVDQKIEDDLNIIRKARFFSEFDIVNSSLLLAKKLVDGDLGGGTDALRSRTLAWCVRILSSCNEIAKAEEYLKYAKDIGTGPEIEIAQAFVYSQKGDKNAALSILAIINESIARSAAFMIVTHHEGAQGGINWLKTVNIPFADLDPDGKYFLLMQYIQLNQWEIAHEDVLQLTNDDLRQTPILNHVAAISYLLIAVPDEFRTLVSTQLPFDAAGFPLASDTTTAITACRTAQRYFILGAQIAEQLNCPRAAVIDSDYALWLELKDVDVETSSNGRRRLEAALCHSNPTLRLVYLGLQFGIKLDLDLVERETERKIALNGSMTQDTAIARFALASVQKNPEDVANYIAEHLDQLANFFDKKFLQFRQVEMLSVAGLTEQAKQLLDFLIQEGLSDVEENRLRRIISEAEGADSIQIRKEQFKTTNSLDDLANLVNELQKREDWDGICEYGSILFERTHSRYYAEQLANALSKTHKNEKIVEFLERNETLLSQSKNLQMLYCWSLYSEGALLRARAELAKMNNKDDINHRALEINLGIALGDWAALSAFVAKECLVKDQRSAQDLIRAAQLALYVDSPHAKELIIAAVAKGIDDPYILTAAYFLATNAGWENDEDVFKWIEKAAALSGENGPIQKATLQDVLDRKPEWDQRGLEILNMLNRADIPMFLAALYLNKSLVDLIFFPSLTNLSENDPRRRGAIPAYSGNRQSVDINIGRTVVIDATALLTLSFLNLLDKAFDVFTTVYIPHSTLGWLFEEKKEAGFHQPSQIRQAHQLRDLIARDILQKFVPSTVADSDLSSRVGDELASLIAEAEKPKDDGVQRIVVRSSPVPNFASLIAEEADLTSYKAILSSCQAVVKKLQQNGVIMADEEKKALNYLQLHEKPWPNQPEIIDRATLYLDDLAISYFLHLGILEKLHSAGFTVIISPKKVSEINELITYERISGQVKDAIEHIRFAVNSRIESGKIKVGRQLNSHELDEHKGIEHPTLTIIPLAANCDALIIDDRFLNQHPHVQHGSIQVPIFTTLDLLDVLLSASSITPEDRLRYRTLLRRAGYFFIPIDNDELTFHLINASVKDEKVVETAELKAIRENVLRVRMSTWLQLPKEAFWLDNSIDMFINTLRGLWKVDSDLSIVRAQSNWLIDQIDFRGWVHLLDKESGDNFVKIGRARYILILLTTLVDVPQDIKDEYWDWIENKILAPIKEQFPEIYSWLVEWHKNHLAEVAEMDLAKWTEGFDE